MALFPEVTTTDPHYADRRNFYKVERWTRDGQHIEAMLYGGSSVDHAREIFRAFARKRPRARLTIRQGTRVLDKWNID